MFRYVYYNELDNHRVYLQMSATLLKVNCEVFKLVLIMLNIIRCY